jgi:dCMP deaminase
MTVNSGIKRVVANVEYPDNTFKDLFSGTGVEFFTLQLGSFSINRLL